MKKNLKIGQRVLIIYGGGGKIEAEWTETLPNALHPLPNQPETKEVRFYLVRDEFGGSCYRADELMPA